MQQAVIVSVAATAALVLVAGTAMPQDEPAFGDEQSAAYAQQLWQALQEQNYVGEGAIRSFAYEGSEPHGIVLEQIEGSVTVDGHEGTLIVKSNFMADDLTTERVMDSDRQEFLAATTVMFRRESGYAPDTGDWFWAKYLPSGELEETPGGVPLAGRVQGCVGCHQGAPGNDYVFLHDRYGE